MDGGCKEDGCNEDSGRDMEGLVPAGPAPMDEE